MLNLPSVVRRVFFFLKDANMLCNFHVTACFLHEELMRCDGVKLKIFKHFSASMKT